MFDAVLKKKNKIKKINKSINQLMFDADLTKSRYLY